MHCGGCNNIPFWRWAKVNQKIPKSITCNDFDGEYLYNIQPEDFSDCFGKYLCTWCWKCYQIYCTTLKMLRKVEDIKEAVNSKDREYNGYHDHHKRHKQRSTKHYTENER